MIAQQGRVIGIEGDEALVRVGGTAGCPACDAGKGCGAGVFGRLLSRGPVTIRVRRGGDLAIGQAVQIGIPEARFVALVFRMYLAPLLAGLAGGALGLATATRWGLDSMAADLWTLACALGSAGLAIALARRSLREFRLPDMVHLSAADPSATGLQCGGREAEG